MITYVTINNKVFTVLTYTIVLVNLYHRNKGLGNKCGMLQEKLRQKCNLGFSRKKNGDSESNLSALAYIAAMKLRLFPDFMSAPDTPTIDLLIYCCKKNVFNILSY